MKFPVVLFLLLSGSAVLAAPPSESIRNFHTDEVLEPACGSSELAKLKAASDHLAQAKNPQGAWIVAKAMLCGSRAPTAYMPLLVSLEQYGVNEDPGPTFALVDQKQIEPLRGVAYGVSVEASGDDLSYNYNTAGVCVGGFTLRLVAAQWLLVRMGEACD
ncbi:hypothetical protein N800_07890 [Lysobacter daejeonensis GH1-9]|uniref:Uncharacterized protein n=1 Tax=Lysobacter daejeonensis GH1-9 TaxID=1385517 RepID=A0A0A0EQS6_9GAMM|nr:hypothetical protein [Lysobacter daejeonensis]KGM53306.1 hypothetical protein N800_07890 [Lysobacter daejeonensis GH1-9]